MKIYYEELKYKLKRVAEFLSICHVYMIGLHVYTLTGIYIIIRTLLSDYYWLVFLYGLFYYFDFDTCDKGSYRKRIFKKLPYIKHGSDYFPIKIHKECDLDPEHNYIFGVVPHAILSYGVVLGLNSRFDELFPLLTLHSCTLRHYFYWPFTREIGFLHGYTSASKKCLHYILRNKGCWKSKGQVCSIVIGGAEEMVHTEPGEYYNLILKNRKGFARVALETGAHLVPVFSFGENDIYKTQKITDLSSKFHKFQRLFKHITTIGFPYGYGRGLFSDWFGFLPFRKPINTVIGTPIPVECVQNPTQEQVDALHEQFIDEMHKLFEKHKVNFKNEINKKIVLV
jgi:2-acylglycerol O-acyltransferase 1